MSETRAHPCMMCGTAMRSSREDLPYEESGLPYVVLENVEVRRCPECGEVEVVLPRIEELHGTIARLIVDAVPSLGPHEIRFLRKHLGYSSADFAERMGVTPETVSRWERVEQPKRMGRTADRLLRLMVRTEPPLREYPTTETMAPVERLAVRQAVQGKRRWQPDQLVCAAC